MMMSPETQSNLLIINALLSGGMLLAFIKAVLVAGRVLQRQDDQERRVGKLEDWKDRQSPSILGVKQ